MSLVLALIRPFGDWFSTLGNGDAGRQQAERDRQAWQTAQGRDEIAAYQAYLQHCADDGCGHRSQAEAKLAALDKARDPTTGMEFVRYSHPQYGAAH